MKKTFSIMILVLMFVLVGCGPAETEEPIDNDLFPEKEWTMLSAAHEEPIEITIWIPNSATSSLGVAVTELTNLYNQDQALTYPGKNIKVIPEFQGTSGALNTKLQAAILAGNNPVISAIGVSSIPLYEAKAVDLRNVYTYDEIKGFNQGLLQYSLYRGKLMFLPYFPSASNIIVANKTLIENKGFTLPTPESIITNPDESNWTWEEFMKIAKGVTTINEVDEKSVYGFASGSVDPIGMMFQQGGKLYNDDVTAIEFDKDDKINTGLQFWRSLVTEKAMRNPNFRASHGSIILSEFYTGNVGMLFTTSSNLKSITDKAEEGNFEVEVFPFPKKTDFFTNQGGSGIVIFDNKSDKEIAAAADFMRWLTEPKQNAYMCSATGYLPLNTATIDTPALIEVYKNYPMMKTASDYMKFGIRSPQGKAKPAADSKVNAYAKQIWSEPNKSIADIVAELIEEAKYEIEANK